MAVMLSMGASSAGAADAPLTAPPEGDDGCHGGGHQFDWSLRLDFNNIDLLACRKDRDSYVPYQEGALLSWTQDELAHSHSATGEGVAAGMIRVYGGYEPFIGFVAGPYIQGDGTYQFASRTAPLKRSDTVIEGGFLQFGVRDRILTNDSDDFFRVRGGEAEATTGIKTTTFVGEWIPRATLLVGGCKVGLYEPTELPCGEPPFDIPITYLFVPELMVQADHLVDGRRTYLLFKQDDSAVRVGPQLSLAIRPYFLQPDSGGLREFANKLTLTTVYHVSTNATAGRGYSWVLTSLTYSPVEWAGVSLSYGAGNSEASANVASQFKIGLTIKH
jgi:hypothetical protein